MKKDTIIMYIIEITLVFVLLCCIIFTNIFTKMTIGILLLVFMLLSNLLIKSDIPKGKYNKKVTLTMFMISIVYLAMIYVSGIYIGFYKPTISFSTWSLINYILPYTVIIISIEIIRKIVLLKENKKSNIIIFIATLLLDISISSNIYNLATLSDYYNLIGFIIFSSIANNMLYNYIIKKYRNCKAIIVYRLITTLYIYILPIIPNMINILFQSIINIIIPYIIFLILEKLYAKKEKQISTRTKTMDITITSILVVIATGIIMLVSCKFKYGILVIATESMTGSINKGDAIIYERLNEEPQKDDIIVFKGKNIKVIHRIVDKRDTGSQIKYYTKGDFNYDIDEGYRTKEDIIGIVKLRIPHIGRFAVLLNEFFK